MPGMKCIIVRLLILACTCGFGAADEVTETLKPVIPTVKLTTGYEMPMLGFGTGKLLKDTKDATRTAIGLGYRLIDTAKVYTTTPTVPSELVIGKLIEDSGVPREDFFILTKILPEQFIEASCRQAIEESLRFLRTSYIDLVLIHTPEYYDDSGMEKLEGTYIDGWKSLELLVDEGKIRSIGVSNFVKEEIVKIQEIAKHPISVLQNWFDPYNQDKMLLMDCEYMDIVYMGYSTLGGVWLEEGMNPNPILNDDVIMKIAAKHNRSPSEAVLNWAVSKGVVVIPASRKEAHMANNMNSLSFELTEEEIGAIGALDGKLEMTYADDGQPIKSLDPIDFVLAKIKYLASFVWSGGKTDSNTEL